MRRSRWLYVGLGTTALVISCAKGAGDDFGTFGGSVPGAAAGDDGDEDEGEGEGGKGTEGPSGTPMSGPAEEDGGDEGAVDGAPGDCCAGNATPGCQDAEIAACVCAQDSFCCDSVWDDICAEMVTELGCAACAGDPEGGDGSETDGGVPPADDDGSSEGGVDPSGPPEPPDDGGGGGFGDCCAANDSPGCDDAAIEACVCAVDSYCCDTDWDSICVDLVASESCGDCGDGGGGETGEPPAGDTDGGTVEADCCTAHGGAGCSDATIEACVCAVDAFCCDTEWDSICVDLVAGQACGDCGGGEPDPTAGSGGDTGGPVPGACCTATATPGCPADPAVQACVCAADAFCCDVEWDGLCVEQIGTEACGTC